MRKLIIALVALALPVAASAQNIATYVTPTATKQSVTEAAPLPVVTTPLAVTASRWTYAAASGGIVNTTTAVTIKAAAGAGVRNYISSLQLDAGTLGAATEVAVRDGAGGTVLWRGQVGTAGAARSITFEVPIKGTANTLLEVVTLTATVTGGVYVNVQGFVAP